MKTIVLSFLLIVSSFATNALVNEKSPYLREHSKDLVNWLPWGKKAFEKAKKEGKPIFLSIGYSTCHWCHIMEKESFKNSEIAKIINKNFIPILVDREESPDIDKYYQAIYQIIHKKGGGWPLNIILTEDMKPFFIRTYIPPENEYGVQGLETILPIIAKSYQKSKKDVERKADEILALMKKVENVKYIPVKLDLNIANKFVNESYEEFDKKYKGFSKKVKFPEPSKINALIDIYMITKNEKAFKMANETLIAMAKSGLYDQVDGAFFRYVTDRRWQIPHFEKMLYTNAELINVYVKMYRITKNPLFKNVVIQTLKEMSNRFGKGGLYYDASDADTNGVEGGYFLYNYEDTLDFFIKNGFKKYEAKKALAYFGIEEDGNFDGVLSNPCINSKIKISQNEKQKALKLLKEIRRKRDYPFIDKKILTSWNAMFIDAKLKACYIDKSYKDSAIDSLNLLLNKIYRDGILYHEIIGDFKPTKKALLEDYAFLIKNLLDAYEYTLDKKYLKLSQKLIEDAKGKFFKNGKWYLNSNRFNVTANLYDSAYASSLAVMIHNFLTLASLKENLKYLKDAKDIIKSNSTLINSNPIAYPEAVRAVLRLKVGDVIIKSKKKNLLKKCKKILSIKYPYILVKESNLDKFLACKIDRCFASGSFKNIKQKIDNQLNFKEKRSRWKKKIEFLPNQ